MCSSDLPHQRERLRQTGDPIPLVRIQFPSATLGDFQADLIRSIFSLQVREVQREQQDGSGMGSADASGHSPTAVNAGIAAEGQGGCPRQRRDPGVNGDENTLQDERGDGCGTPGTPRRSTRQPGMLGAGKWAKDERNYRLVAWDTVTVTDRTVAGLKRQLRCVLAFEKSVESIG